MPRWVALLRSVNVGGRRITMTELVASFDALGYKDVTTYIQTGNVLFTSAVKNGARLATDIEAQLEADFGTSPAVIMRTAAELARVARSSPYAKAGAEPNRHHVTFLAEKPSAERLRDFTTPPSGRDQLVIDGLEVYVHTPDGYGTSKLNGALIERRLGVLSTTRNWNTVTTLSELAGG